MKNLECPMTCRRYASCDLRLFVYFSHRLNDVRCGFHAIFTNTTFHRWLIVGFRSSPIQ